MRNIDKVILFTRRLNPWTVFTTSDVISETSLTTAGSGAIVNILRKLEKYGFIEYVGHVYGTRNATAWRTVSGDRTPLKPLNIMLTDNETERAVKPSEENKE